MVMSHTNVWNSTSLTALIDYQGDLDKFYQYFTHIPNGTAPIDLSIDGGAPPPSAPHARDWHKVGGESDLDLQSALPIVYPQNVTVYQTDDRHYAHLIDYSYHHLELFNDFLDAVSTQNLQDANLVLTRGRRLMAHTAPTLLSARRVTIRSMIQNIPIRDRMATKVNYNVVYSSRPM